MATIPGLLHTPVEDITPIDVESKGIELMAFNLKPYTVPESHRYGKCRLISEFENISVLGEGAYGIVYKVKDNKSDEIFALKKLKIEKGTQSLPLSFIREVTVLKSMNHDNVVSISGIAVGRTLESTYVILEYCPYELSKVLDDEEAQAMIELPQVKYIMKQLFTGLEHVHKHFVLHRDLSVSNILFSASGVLKISDFGVSRLDTSEGIEDMTPNVVSRWYRAPELLLGSKQYSTAIDVWSAGCIFAELLQKKPLFQSDSDTGMIALIVEMLGTPTETSWPGFSTLPVLQNYELFSQPYNKLSSHFDGQSVYCIGLLHKLFVYNPKARISARECLTQPYFSKDETPACEPDALIAVLKKCQEI